MGVNLWHVRGYGHWCVKVRPLHLLAVKLRDGQQEKKEGNLRSEKLVEERKIIRSMNTQVNKLTQRQMVLIYRENNFTRMTDIKN